MNEQTAEVRGPVAPVVNPGSISFALTKAVLRYTITRLEQRLQGVLNEMNRGELRLIPVLPEARKETDIALEQLGILRKHLAACREVDLPVLMSNLPGWLAEDVAGDMKRLVDGLVWQFLAAPPAVQGATVLSEDERR